MRRQGPLLLSGNHQRAVQSCSCRTFCVTQGYQEACGVARGSQCVAARCTGGHAGCAELAPGLGLCSCSGRRQASRQPSTYTTVHACALFCCAVPRCVPDAAQSAAVGLAHNGVGAAAAAGWHPAVVPQLQSFCQQRWVQWCRSYMRMQDAGAGQQGRQKGAHSSTQQRLRMCTDRCCSAQRV